MQKNILYVDLDGVLMDFKSEVNNLPENIKLEYENRLDEVPNIYKKIKPIRKSIEAITQLSNYYDVYILSTAPFNCPSAWVDKLLWVKEYLPKIGHEKLIFSHHKNLNKGQYLIDDRKTNGVTKFEGKHIYFGKGNYKDWMAVYRFLVGELWSKKVGREKQTELIYKIKKGSDKATINSLLDPYRPYLEKAILLFCNDLDPKEHKILQSIAKNAFLKSILEFDEERNFPIVHDAFFNIKNDLLDYLSKRDGWKRLPRCKVGRKIED